MCLLVFRNKLGATLFSGNVVKGVSRHREVSEKPHKCQYKVAVVGKDEGNGKLVSKFCCISVSPLLTLRTKQTTLSAIVRTG